MSDSKVNVHNSGGCGFLGLLFLVFLVLKLTGVIAWSWWWVTAPLWAPVLFFLAVLGFVALLGIMVVACEAVLDREKKRRKK